MSPSSRNTHQKQSVLNVLKAMHGEHPTADAVYERVLQTLPTISRATVYRILNQYADQGVITRMHAPDSPVRYDDLTESHHHLVCSSCNRLLDLPGMQVQEIPLPEVGVAGCRITGVELIFRGICPECASRT